MEECFWMDPSWRRDAPAPGKDCELVRKFKSQMAAFRDPSMVAKRTHSFDELIARDEARLDKAKARYKRNREALAAGDRPVSEPEL